MSKAKPFSWIVRFTVAPMWIQDGFSLSNERALSMLAEEVSGAYRDELSAEVLQAPSPLEICRMQGYGADDYRSAGVIKELRDGTPSAGKLRNTLIHARDLLDSVAFVAQPGDTEKALGELRAAIESLDTRQGEPVEIDN